MNRQLEGEFPKTACKRIMKKAIGGGMRTSDDGAVSLARVLEDIEYELAPIILKYAYNRGKKTIQKEDVLNAVEEWRDMQ